MFVWGVFEGEGVAVLVLADILAVEVFAGELAPVGYGEGSAVPPQVERAGEGVEVVAPAVAGTGVMAEHDVEAEAGEAADFKVEGAVEATVGRGVDGAGEEEAVAEV